MNLKLFLIFCLSGAISFSVWAQKPRADSVKPKWKPATVKLRDPSLKGQYDYLLSRSKYTPDGYRAIANYRLTQFWINVSDTLATRNKELTTLRAKSIEQEKTISYLKTNLAEKESDQQVDQAKTTQISFLGIAMNKNFYHGLVWSIIGILFIALVIAISRIAKNNFITREKIEAYEEISTEFQQYKSKAVEKERKLARQLQDERNKLDELNGRG